MLHLLFWDTGVLQKIVWMDYSVKETKRLLKQFYGGEKKNLFNFEDSFRNVNIWENIIYIIFSANIFRISHSLFLENGSQSVIGILFFFFSKPAQVIVIVHSLFFFTCIMVILAVDVQLLYTNSKIIPV